MRYFRLTQSFQESDRWFLGKTKIDGVEVDPRIFTSGQPLNQAATVEIEVRKPGSPLDITLGDYDMPFFSEKALYVVRDLIANDVEIIPAYVKSDSIKGFVVNVTQMIDCIDESRSKFTRWTEADKLPHKVGKFQSIYELFINPEKVNNHHIFRIKDWKVALIVSESIAERFESFGIRDIHLKRV